MSSRGGTRGTFPTLRRSLPWPRSAYSLSFAEIKRPSRPCCAPLTPTVTVGPPGTPSPRSGGRLPGKNAKAALADFRNSIGVYPSAADLATVDVPVVCSYGARSPFNMVRLVRALAWPSLVRERAKSKEPATLPPSTQPATSWS
jgi:hypothetical protein